jgi:hypothetical protein
MMCYGENGTVKFLETLADNVFRYNYSMMQIKTKLNYRKILGLPRPTPLNPKWITFQESHFHFRITLLTIKY